MRFLARMRRSSLGRARSGIAEREVEGRGAVEGELWRGARWVGFDGALGDSDGALGDSDDSDRARCGSASAGEDCRDQTGVVSDRSHMGGAVRKPAGTSPAWSGGGRRASGERAGESARAERGEWRERGEQQRGEERHRQRGVCNVSSFRPASLCFRGHGSSLAGRAGRC